MGIRLDRRDFVGRGALLFAFVAALGCNNTITIEGGGNSGDGGNGGSGGSGGGAGASSATTTPANDPGVWSLRVVNEGASVNQGIPDPPPRTTGSACGVLLPEEPPVETELASAGVCRLIQIAPSEQAPWFPDAGEVGFSSENIGKWELLPPEDAGKCLWREGDGNNFLPKEPLTFTTTGGADLPALTIEVIAPGMASLSDIDTPSKLVPGEPYSVFFGEEPAGRRVELFFGFTSDDAPFIRCAPTDAGPMDIDASLTALITQDISKVIVRVSNAVTVESTEGTTTIRATVESAHKEVVTVL